MVPMIIGMLGSAVLTLAILAFGKRFFQKKVHASEIESPADIKANPKPKLEILNPEENLDQKELLSRIIHNKRIDASPRNMKAIQDLNL